MLRYLLQVAIVLAICVVVLGAYTRLTDAGLGCPDWPGCYGMLTVPQGAEIEAVQQVFPERPVEVEKAWNEMIHRYLAGSLGLLIFMMMCVVLKTRNKHIKHWAIALSCLVIFQAALGMWTVTLKLMPVIVMAHLLGGFAIVCLLVLMYLKLHLVRCSNTCFSISDKMCKQPNQVSIALNVLPFLIKLGYIAIGVLIFQIMLGGWTSSNYAALVCTELPICQGNWFMQLKPAEAFSLLSPAADNYEFGVLDYDARVTIHVTHRVGAVITACILCFLFSRLLFNKALKIPLIKKITYIACTLLIVQIALGVSNIVFMLPLAIAVAHNVVALLLLASLVSIVYCLHVNRGQAVKTELHLVSEVRHAQYQ